MKEWKTDLEIKCADKCTDLEVRQENVIHIPRKIEQVFREMCRRFPKDEWQLLLTGEIADNEIHVDGYYVPKQEVSAAYVRNLDVITREFIVEKRIIAGIHSHVDMGVFFSATDDETCKSAIRYHIVTNNRGEYVTRGRHTLACGREGFKPMKLEFETVVEDAIIIDGIERITKPEPVTYDPQYGYYPDNDDIDSKYDVSYEDGVKVYKPKKKSYGWNQDYSEYKGIGHHSNVYAPASDPTLGVGEGTYFHDEATNMFYLDNGMTFDGKYAVELGDV